MIAQRKASGYQRSSNVGNQEPYPVCFEQWCKRLESDDNNFSDGIPVFDCEQRFQIYRRLYRSKIKGKFVFPTMVAMYGLAKYNRYIASGNANDLYDAGKMLEWLEGNVREFGRPLLAHFFMPTYNLEAPWPNAMSCGLYLSLASRFAEACPDCVQKVIRFMNLDVKDGGVLRCWNDYTWLEEYPAKTGSYVFNGHNFAVIGLNDVRYVLNPKQESVLKSAMNSAFKAAELITLDCGWTYYDLKRKTFSTNAYQLIHAEQMEFLSQFFPKFQREYLLNDLIPKWNSAHFSKIPKTKRLEISIKRIFRQLKRFFDVELWRLK